MTDRTYLRLLTGVVIAGLALTVLHAVYALWSYEHASIIQFISQEWW